MYLTTWLFLSLPPVTSHHSLAENRFKRYTSGHVYRPKMFSSAFTNPKKNKNPVSVKDKTIGRPGASLQADEDNDDADDDYDDDTFPDDAELSSTSPEEDITAAPAISAEEDTADENDSEDDSDDGSSSEEEQQDETEAVEDEDVTEKGNRKRPLKKVTYAKSSRKVRDADVPPNENAVSRKTNPTNMMADVVASKFPIRAMTPGQVKSCLEYSIQESFPRLNVADRCLLSEHTRQVMSTLARVHTDLLREGLQVADLYIAAVFREFPDIDGDQAQEHADKRKENFNNLLVKGPRESFFRRLLYRLLHWDFSDSVYSAKASAAALAADSIFEKYLKLTSNRQDPPFRPTDNDVCDSTFLDQCVRSLGDMVGSHIYKFTLELKKRVGNHRRVILLHSLHTDTHLRSHR